MTRPFWFSFELIAISRVNRNWLGIRYQILVRHEFSDPPVS